MTRAKPIQATESGHYPVKVRLPGLIFQICRELADVWGVSVEQGIQMFLERTVATFEENKGKLIGGEFERAYLKLRNADALPVAGLPPIDISKLHRSTQTKSGLVGIYAYGKGFRAMARMPGEDRMQR